MTGQNRLQKIALPENRKNKIAAPPPFLYTMTSPLLQNKKQQKKKQSSGKFCFVWMLSSFILVESEDKEPYYTLGCITRTSQQNLFLCRLSCHERKASPGITLLLF